LVESGDILDYKNGCDDRVIYFKVIFQKTIIDSLDDAGIIKKLKLTSTVNTSNMHVFDEKCTIRKISCPEEIIFRFYNVRKEHYIKRKKYLVEKLSQECSLLESKIRFIQLVITEEIVVFNKRKEFITKQLLTVNPPLLKVENSWDYLLDLKIHFLTEEKINDLKQKMKMMNIELETLKSTNIQSLWNSELLNTTF
jgi:DNA topoisomerase-2